MRRNAGRRRSGAEGGATWDEALAGVARAVASAGAIPKSALAEHGVAKARLRDACAQLAGSGFEVTSKFVRLPVARQLAEQLESRATLPLRGLESYLAGASKRDATVAAGVLVDTGRARWVVRSTEMLLAAPSAGAVDDAELARLESAIGSLAVAVKLARRKGATLLRGDVQEVLRGVCVPAATELAAASGTRARSAGAPEVMRSIDDHRDASGLTWVPSVVRALGGPAACDAVHAELLRGARAGKLELRPESGMGRLSDDDAALCVPGPQGSRLSWVRRIEEPS